MSSKQRMMHQVRALPESPGVYLMRDANEDIIYIGKALKRRTEFDHISALAVLWSQRFEH